MWIGPENLRNTRDSSTLATVLNKMNLETETVGVVRLEVQVPWHMEGILPYNLWRNNILKRFPHAQFKPVGTALAQVIMPQSQEEIAVVRHSEYWRRYGIYHGASNRSWDF